MNVLADRPMADIAPSPFAEILQGQAWMKISGVLSAFTVNHSIKFECPQTLIESGRVAQVFAPWVNSSKYVHVAVD